MIPDRSKRSTTVIRARWLGWRVEGGVWRVACGGWRVEGGVWRVACGGWRIICGVGLNCTYKKY